MSPKEEEDEDQKKLEALAALLPEKVIKDPEQVRLKKEGMGVFVEKGRFYLAFIILTGFLILLSIPLLRAEEDLLKTIAAILAGPVGAVLGYYFGARRKEEAI